MFERFTDRARRVVVLAQEEARLLNHNYIGTEHILLGIVHEGEGVGAKALAMLDIPLEALRTEVEAIIGVGPQAPSGHIPFTPRAKKVLELSLREALQLGHNYIGTEHILLGLIREGEGVGAQVLVRLGAGLDAVRQKIIQLLSGYQEAPGPEMRVTNLEAPPGDLERCLFCGRDLMEVDRYIVGDAATICDVCAIDAYHVVQGAQGERVLRLPPRVFGDPTPEPEAITEMATALGVVFGGEAEADTSNVLEDAEQLAAVRTEVRRRFPQVVPPSVGLTRVRARGPDDADVRFTIVLGGGGGPTVEGRMIRIDGLWRVSRETFCQVMGMAGVQCPPPEPQTG